LLNDDCGLNAVLFSINNPHSKINNCFYLFPVMGAGSRVIELCDAPYALHPEGEAAAFYCFNLEGYPLDSPSYHILYSVAWKSKNTHVISWNLNLNIVMSKNVEIIFSASDGRKDLYALDVRVRDLLNLAICIDARNVGTKYRLLLERYSIGRIFHCPFGFVRSGGLPVKRMEPVLLA